MALLKEDPAEMAALLTYAMRFPDFPKNLSLPALTDPNYVPPDRGKPLEIYAYAMMALTTLTVIVRLWIRKRVKGMVFGWDDWLIIPGQVLALGMMVTMVLLIRLGGVGMHTIDLPFKRLENTQKLQFVGVLIYFAAIFFIRLSITALLYRLMGHSSKIKRILLHITVFVLVAEFVIQVFAFVFASKPISAGWDFMVRITGFKATVNLPLEIFILTIFYLLADVWLLVFPIHTIWTLQLPLRTRISVTWVFIFGGVACAGAIEKTVNIYSVFNSYDPTWNGIGFITGALTEVAFGVVSSSMPALNHLIITALPRTLESVLGSRIFSGWLSSESNKSKGSDPPTSNPKRNDYKTTSSQDDSPFYDNKTPLPFYDKGTARKGYITRTREVTIKESQGSGQVADTYTPGWLSSQYGAGEKDLEANNSLDLTNTSTSGSTHPTTETETASHESRLDPNQYSWLHIH